MSHGASNQAVDIIPFHPSSADRSGRSHSMVLSKSENKSEDEQRDLQSRKAYIQKAFQGSDLDKVNVLCLYGKPRGMALFSLFHFPLSNIIFFE